MSFVPSFITSGRMHDNSDDPALRFDSLGSADFVGELLDPGPDPRPLRFCR